MNAFNTATAGDFIQRLFPRFITELGLQLNHSDQGRVVLRLPFSPVTCRDGGIVSGQMLAALADTSMVCAVWSAIGEHRPLATVDLHVTYLRAVQNDDLLATAEVIKIGRSMGFAKVVIAGAASPDKPAASAVGTFAFAGN
ncbi:MAG: hypothetical protein RL758_1613 [Pseudomonadota bacterium]|jgi:uncharacterized protein (TIGR00369 family)